MDEVKISATRSQAASRSFTVLPLRPPALDNSGLYQNRCSATPDTDIASARIHARSTGVGAAGSSAFFFGELMKRLIFYRAIDSEYKQRRH